MITGRRAPRIPTSRSNGWAREIGSSMKSVDRASRASAGVFSTASQSAAMPPTSGYCSLPSRVARYAVGLRSSTAAIAVIRARSAPTSPPTFSLK
jgi:hypothetical protein